MPPCASPSSKVVREFFRTLSVHFPRLRPCFPPTTTVLSAPKVLSGTLSPLFAYTRKQKHRSSAFDGRETSNVNREMSPATCLMISSIPFRLSLFSTIHFVKTSLVPLFSLSCFKDFFQDSKQDSSSHLPFLSVIFPPTTTVGGKRGEQEGGI